MKTLILLVMGLVSIPILALRDAGAADPEKTALPVPEEPNHDLAVLEEPDLSASSALAYAPCPCVVPLIPIKGTITSIRANNCFTMATCATPSDNILIQGPIPGVSVGNVVFFCGTEAEDLCNTDRDGYQFSNATIVADCDDCP